MAKKYIKPVMKIVEVGAVDMIAQSILVEVPDLDSDIKADGTDALVREEEFESTKGPFDFDWWE